MRKDIEMITNDGTVYIGDVSNYDSVVFEKRKFGFSDADKYCITLYIYIKYRDYEDVCVSHESQSFIFKDYDIAQRYYEEIKTILKRKNEE